jgi:hypothetical protein
LIKVLPELKHRDTPPLAERAMLLGTDEPTLARIVKDAPVPDELAEDDEFLMSRPRGWTGSTRDIDLA